MASPKHSKIILTTKSIGNNTGIDRIALKIGEAAEAIGVKPITIRRMIDRGILKPYRGIRHPLIPVKQLTDLMK